LLGRSRCRKVKRKGKRKTNPRSSKNGLKKRENQRIRRGINEKERTDKAKENKKKNKIN